MASDIPKKTAVYLDETLRKKVEWLADSEVRSVSGQLRFITKEFVDEYERKYGPIPIKDNK